MAAAEKAKAAVSALKSPRYRFRYMADLEIPLRYLPALRRWPRTTREKRDQLELWRTVFASAKIRILGSLWNRMISVRGEHPPRVLLIEVCSVKRLSRMQLGRIRRGVYEALKARPGRPGWFFHSKLVRVRISQKISDPDLLRVILAKRIRK